MNLKEIKSRMSKKSVYQWHQKGSEYILHNPVCLGLVHKVYTHYDAERMTKSLRGAGYKIGKVPVEGMM